MTETIEIPAFEHGVVRVFDGRFASEAALRAYAAPEGAEEGAPWPLRDELGAGRLETRGVEAFPMRNLDGMGLPGYLRMAYGVSDRDAAHPALGEAAGSVILLSSRAFGGREARLRVPERLRYLGAYRDAEAHAAPRPAPTLGRTAGEAEGRGAPAAEAPAERRGASGRRAAGAGAIALGALLVAAGVVGNDWWLWAPGLAVAVGGAVVAARARRAGGR